MTDAFGSRGGIAQYNRHLLQAICADSRVRRVVVLPRVATEPFEAMPEKLEFVSASLGGLSSYTWELGRRFLRGGAFEIVMCGHVNLLPAAFAAARRYGAKLFLMTYGVEVWRSPRRRLSLRLLGHVDAIGTISATTRDRMLAWFPGKPPPVFLLPNAFDPNAFAPGPKRDSLVIRLGLQGKRAVLIFGRMDPSERCKGFDELLEATPALLERNSDLMVIMAGEGADRSRLMAKAAQLGVANHVVFTGYVPETEKSDLYRLSDVFILPSRQEGFGFVLLEAMACGVPVIGSLADGSREAVLDGKIGLLVDPTSRDDIVRTVCVALSRPRIVPRELSQFSFEQFQNRASALLTYLSQDGSQGPLMSTRP